MALGCWQQYLAKPQKRVTLLPAEASASPNNGPGDHLRRSLGRDRDHNGGECNRPDGVACASRD